MNLSFLVLWPLVSGVFLFGLHKKHQAAQILNVVFQVIWAIGLLFVTLRFQSEIKTAQFIVVESYPLLDALKTRASFAIDGISYPLIALNVFLSLCLSFYSLGKKALSGTYLGLFSLLNAASVGSLLAADAFFFYIFWEAMLIPMYFLIGCFGGTNKSFAALKFFAFTMAGSLPMLLAVLALSFVDGVQSLEWGVLSTLKIPFNGWSSLGGLIALGFLLAFVVKIPVWPLHSWLPDAHTEAPTGASVILAGVLLKLGVYGIVRWCIPLFPEACAAISPLFLILGCAGILIGSFGAWKQSDIKRAIAYSSVAHLGFMVIGIFSMKVESLQGALFQNIAHGLSTGALFLIFGMIYDRTHTRKISEYGGVATASGWVGFLFVFSTMASIGLPGLPGFVGEFLILSGTFVAHPWTSLVASLGVLFGAVYMLSLVRKVFWGPVSALVKTHPVKLTYSEYFAIVPFLLAMTILGLFPQFVLNTSQSAVLHALGVR